MLQVQSTHDPADAAVFHEHPANAGEFASVAVLAALAHGTDMERFALPPLWPMVLHYSFVDLLSSRADHLPVLSVAAIPELIRALRSPLHRHQHDGAIGIRRLLNIPRGTTPPFAEIIAAGAVPLLAALLRNDIAPPATQFDAARALADMVVQPASYEQITYVAHSEGVIPGIVELLGSTEHEDVTEKAVFAVGNIAVVSTTFRDLLLERGVLEKLLDLAFCPKTSMPQRRTAARIIALCCRGKPSPPLSATAAAIPRIVKLIDSADAETAYEAIHATAYICSGGNNRITAAIEHGALPAIFRRLSTGHGAEPIDLPTLHCLSIIVAGDERHVALAVEHGAIPTICATLRIPGLPSRLAVSVGVLADIAIGNAGHISALLHAGAFDLIAVDANNADTCLREESQRFIGVVLRDASAADCVVIIQSAAFKRLTAATHQGRLEPDGVECLAVAFERAFDTVAAALDPDELSGLMQALGVKRGRRVWGSSRIRDIVRNRQQLAAIPPPAAGACANVSCDVAGHQDRAEPTACRDSERHAASNAQRGACTVA
jgi:hypothetical protein